MELKPCVIDCNMSNVVFPVKPYPVDLPVQHYRELSTGCDEYMSSVQSDGAMASFSLPHGQKVRTNTLACNTEFSYSVKIIANNNAVLAGSSLVFDRYYLNSS